MLDFHTPFKTLTETLQQLCGQIFDCDPTVAQHLEPLTSGLPVTHTNIKVARDQLEA